jgi:protein gp37
MSDLFHEQVPFEFINKVFATMVDCPQHTFQVLTKRSERMCELAEHLPWPENVWMGVSVEDARHAFRIRDLQRTPAHVKFLSCEPLLGPIEQLPLKGIHWVIVGGESGPGSRVMEPAWAKSIKEQCINDKVPFFFKQWGGFNKKAAGRKLDGKTYDEMPRRECRSVA